MKLLIFILVSLSLSVSFADLRQDLARLYPEQTSDTLQKRIDQIESPQEFFRAFTPYFHFRLVQGPFRSAPWNPLRQRVAWCLGDPHPENFGAVIGKNGRAQYLPNDIDDVHPCPLAADLLRFLVGWNLWGGEGGTEELLATYLSVRRSGRVPLPPQVIALLLRESEFRGQRASLKWYHPDLRVLRRRSDLSAIPSPFDRDVAQVATEVLEGQGRVLQVAERIRLEGGSGGVKRFLALMDRGSEGPLLLEFKEIVRPSTFPWGVPLVDPFLRIQTAWTMLRNENLTDFEKTVTLFNRPFYTRPLWEGSIDLNLSNLSSLQLREVAHYQAALLASFHRSSQPEFPIDFDSIPPQVWARTVSQMSDEIQRAYLELRGPMERRR